MSSALFFSTIQCKLFQEPTRQPSKEQTWKRHPKSKNTKFKIQSTLNMFFRTKISWLLESHVWTLST